MAYGYFGAAAMSDDWAAEERVDGTRLCRGKRGRLFAAMVVHVSWTLAALGACWGALSEISRLMAQRRSHHYSPHHTHEPGHRAGKGWCGAGKVPKVHAPNLFPAFRS